VNARWDQSKVFEALVRRNGPASNTLQPYVWMYRPQDKRSALLYQGLSNAPVHINHRRCDEYWGRIKQCLPYLSWVSRDPSSKKTVFDKYRVDDWDAFAQALGLGSDSGG
jgi:hypothetical protein